jgi:hypothetical protein
LTQFKGGAQSARDSLDQRAERCFAGSVDRKRCRGVPLSKFLNQFKDDHRPVDRRSRRSQSTLSRMQASCPVDAGSDDAARTTE